MLAAAVQREDCVTQNTNDKEYRVWKRWNDYAAAIIFAHDLWHQILTQEQ
jgi:hypothetical protein